MQSPALNHGAAWRGSGAEVLDPLAEFSARQRAGRQDLGRGRARPGSR